MKFLWILILSSLIFTTNWASAKNQEEIDKLMRLPNEFVKKMDERDILMIYFGYEDLNQYLISINEKPIFCSPSNFDPLDLIKWVHEDFIHSKYYLGKEKIGTRYPVALHISAILVDKFPCSKK